MDSSERLAEQYLLSQGFANVVYEPGGNVPPDFLVDGHIAVEVRRLNQNHSDGVNTRGLEEVAIPLWKKVENLVKSFGAPTAAESWFVFFRFSRPIAEWKVLEQKIRNALQTFEKDTLRKSGTIFVDSGFEMDVIRAGKVHSTKYLMAGYSDAESGGAIFAEMEANITYCATEKSQKIARFRSNYQEWWLVLIDHIGFGMNDSDRSMFREQVSVSHNWDKIIIVDPLDISRHLEL